MSLDPSVIRELRLHQQTGGASVSETVSTTPSEILREESVPASQSWCGRVVTWLKTNVKKVILGIIAIAATVFAALVAFGRREQMRDQQEVSSPAPTPDQVVTPAPVSPAASASDTLNAPTEESRLSGGRRRRHRSPTNQGPVTAERRQRSQRRRIQRVAAAALHPQAQPTTATVAASVSPRASSAVSPTEVTTPVAPEAAQPERADSALQGDDPAPVVVASTPAVEEQEQETRGSVLADTRFMNALNLMVGRGPAAPAASEPSAPRSTPTETRGEPSTVTEAIDEFTTTQRPLTHLTRGRARIPAGRRQRSRSAAPAVRV